MPTPLPATDMSVAERVMKRFREANISDVEVAQVFAELGRPAVQNRTWYAKWWAARRRRKTQNVTFTQEFNDKCALKTTLASFHLWALFLSLFLQGAIALFF